MDREGIVPGIAELFAAYLLLHASHPAASGELNAPATPPRIAEAEREIGHPLTEDLRALYAIGDGQPSDGGYDPERIGGDVYLFFGRWFRSIDEALEERRRLLADDARGFEPDWFPFATDDEGNGYAVDLESDELRDRGQLVSFSEGGALNLHRSSIAELLQGYLEGWDPLSLARQSTDPYLSELGRWFEDHAGELEYEVHRQFTDALYPSIRGDRIFYGSEIAEFYDQVLAVQVDLMRRCEPEKLDATLRATNLAVDWLRHIRQIDDARHEHLAGVLANEDGLGDAALRRAGARRTSPEPARQCVYTWLYDRGERSPAGERPTVWTSAVPRGPGATR